MALNGDFAASPTGRAAQDMKGFDGIGAGRRFALVQADPPPLGRPMRIKKSSQFLVENQKSGYNGPYESYASGHGRQVEKGEALWEHDRYKMSGGGEKKFFAEPALMSDAKGRSAMPRIAPSGRGWSHMDPCLAVAFFAASACKTLISLVSRSGIAIFCNFLQLSEVSKTGEMKLSASFCSKLQAKRPLASANGGGQFRPLLSRSGRGVGAKSYWDHLGSYFAPLNAQCP